MSNCNEIIKRLENLAKHAVHYVGEPPFVMSLDDGIALHDAVALLKEQEPRVLTLEDVCGGDECWIEYRYGGNGYADVYFSSEPDGTALVYRCSPVRDRKPETVWFHDYGKLWRGWSYRPSLEQMRDTKWEGDSDAE